MQRDVAGRQGGQPGAPTKLPRAAGPAALRLQRAIGNRAVSQLMRTPASGEVEAKVTFTPAASRKGAAAASAFVVDARAVEYVTPRSTPGAVTVSLVKEWDRSSPRLHAALFGNQSFKKVRLEMFRTNQVTGNRESYYALTLTDARITEIQQAIGGSTAAGGARHSQQHDSAEIEHVHLTAAKAKSENLGGAAKDDSWRDQWRGAD